MKLKAKREEGGKVSDTEWLTFSPVRWNPEGEYVKEIDKKQEAPLSTSDFRRHPR